MVRICVFWIKDNRCNSDYGHEVLKCDGKKQPENCPYENFTLNTCNICTLFPKWKPDNSDTTKEDDNRPNKP